MIGTSDGKSYEDGLDHLNDNPILGPAPLPSENTKLPDKQESLGPSLTRYKVQDRIMDDILDPGKPMGPTKKQIIPGQHSPQYNPDQNPNFPNVYTELPELGRPDKNLIPLSPTRPFGGQPIKPLQPPIQPGQFGEKLGSVDINTDYNVKSGAVASKDTDTVYIDPKIPAEFHPFLAEHENVEKSLMAPPRSLPYDKAHVIATLAEKHMVEQAGMDWKTYTDAVDPHVAEAEKGSGKNPPPDPHEKPEDAIGHHVSSAKTLERADMQIAMEDTRKIVPEGLGRASGGGQAIPFARDKAKVQPIDPVDAIAAKRSIYNRDPTIDEIAKKAKKIGPMSDVDERPIAGQKYAMEDKRVIVPEGPGRAGSGGGVRIPEASEMATKAEQALKLQHMGTGKDTKRLGSNRIFHFGKEDTEHHELMIGDKSVGQLSVTPKTMKGHKVLEMEYAEGTTASAAATPAQRINAMAKFKEALSDKYPEAIGTYGLRITGGKLEHGGDPWQYIPLKEGWSRKSLRELHMSDRMKIDNPEQLRSFMEYYDRTRPIGRSR